ncbi:hypothetical protein LB505_000281 [Fusarium chuoi]|nr:hypothetical protein LB505_000281 [Fusarium chuoi]
MSTESDAEKQQPGISILWERDPENPQNWSLRKKTLNLGISFGIICHRPGRSSPEGRLPRNSTTRDIPRRIDLCSRLCFRSCASFAAVRALWTTITAQCL